MKKISLRSFGLIGILLFLPLFLLTFINPHQIEQSGQAFIKWKVTHSVNDKIDSIKLPKATKLENLLGTKAKDLRKQTDTKIAELKSQLKNETPALMAAQLAKMRNLDCECRKKWQQHLEMSLTLKISTLEAAKEKLVKFSQAKYMQVMQKLTLDIRIFLGANAFIFMFLLLASFLKPAAVTHLFLPSVLMMLSTIICSYFYIFEQNWLFTIIYNDYTGFSFIAYLALVFSFLCDIVFNRGRVTTEIINGLLNTIGHAATIVPC